HLEVVPYFQMKIQALFGWSFNHHYGKVVTSIDTCPMQVHLEVVPYFQMKIQALFGCKKKTISTKGVSL
ncbi:hypothetical protein, partial [Vibrio cholerae]|uniref:hypothetical protein n=1 Tax=Vibrio cholerae TaxID=666 RepID=UPI001F2DCC70